MRPLRSARQADRASDISWQLATRPKLSRDEQDYLDVLTSLIESYEDEHCPMSTVDTPRELLRFLMEENQLTLTQLANETGIRVSTLSEILNGKREIGLPHVRKLSARFHCEPGVWIDQTKAAAS